MARKRGRYVRFYTPKRKHKKTRKEEGKGVKG
jgi:hypothetical protein